MPHSTRLDRLRDAIKEEKVGETNRLQRCNAFIAQLNEYQQGQGPLPSEQSFLEWRQDIEQIVLLGELGLGELRVNPDAAEKHGAPQPGTRGPQQTGSTAASRAPDTPREHPASR